MKEARHLLDCKDVAFASNLERLLQSLIYRYGTGYDRVKTLSIIAEGIRDDLGELDQWRKEAVR